MWNTDDSSSLQRREKGHGLRVILRRWKYTIRWKARDGYLHTPGHWPLPGCLRACLRDVPLTAQRREAAHGSLPFPSLLWDLPLTPLKAFSFLKWSFHLSLSFWTLKYQHFTSDVKYSLWDLLNCYLLFVAEIHSILRMYSLFLLSFLRRVGPPKDPGLAKLSRISRELGAYQQHVAWEGRTKKVREEKRRERQGWMLWG